MEVDESPLELLVYRSVKAAHAAAIAVIERRQRQNHVKPLLEQEEIGIFVTCLRTQLARGEYELPAELSAAYKSTKQVMTNTDNWVGVGQFGPAQSEWTQTPSGRYKQVRRFSRAGIPDISDYTFNKAHAVAEKSMDKARMIQMVTQARQNDGFDFDASFNAMLGHLRDMNFIVKQAESISGQATKVTEQLCEVAESLAAPM